MSEILNADKKKAKDEIARSNLYKYLVYLVLMFPLDAWEAYVVTVMWAWFVVPQFHVLTLSVPLTMGMMVLLSLLKFKYEADNADNSEVKSVKLLRRIEYAIMVPALILGVGWLIHIYVVTGGHFYISF